MMVDEAEAWRAEALCRVLIPSCSLRRRGSGALRRLRSCGWSVSRARCGRSAWRLGCGSSSGSGVARRRVSVGSCGKSGGSRCGSPWCTCAVRCRRTGRISATVRSRASCVGEPTLLGRCGTLLSVGRQRREPEHAFRSPDRSAGVEADRRAGVRVVHVSGLPVLPERANVGREVRRRAGVQRVYRSRGTERDRGFVGGSS